MSPFPASGLPWLTGRVRRRRMLRPQAASHRGRGAVKRSRSAAERAGRHVGRVHAGAHRRHRRRPCLLCARWYDLASCRCAPISAALAGPLSQRPAPCRADGKPARNGKRKGQSSLRRWRRGARRWPRDPTADSRRRSPRVASLGRAARRAEDFAGRSGSGAKPNFRFHGRFRFAV